MITATGLYISGNLTETGRLVSSGLTEVEECAPSSTIVNFATSGGAVFGGAMSVQTLRNTMLSGGVVASGVLQIKYSNRIFKDGIEISKQYHRTTLAPGVNIDNQESQIKNIAAVVWTPDVISNYTTLVQKEI